MTPSSFEAYKKSLIHLGTQGSRLVQEIFANAGSFIRKRATLSTLAVEIDKLDWYSARQLPLMVAFALTAHRSHAEY